MAVKQQSPADSVCCADHPFATSVSRDCDLRGDFYYPCFSFSPCNIGMYRQRYVFYSIQDQDICIIFIRDKEWAIDSRKLSFDLLGNRLNNPSGGDPEKHTKITNEKLYLLGNKQNDWIITIFEWKELFDRL